MESRFDHRCQILHDASQQATLSKLGLRKSPELEIANSQLVEDVEIHWILIIIIDLFNYPCCHHAAEFHTAVSG